ncbi:MAG TPA: DUF6702 family protein [Gemmatimonadaceae bacterium]|nr:DUF6702 family protein [Gemmatimonadaceae bacterium]
MRRFRSCCAVLLSLAFLATLIAGPAMAHPLHTSLAELTEKGTGDFTVSLRVFADDFMSHTGVTEANATTPVPNARILSYLMRHFVIIDRSSRGLPLKWCGSRRVEDLLVICLSGRVAGGLRGTRIRYSVLTDLFPDQINVLQLSTGARRKSLLFTPAETTRTIR